MTTNPPQLRVVPSDRHRELTSVPIAHDGLPPVDSTAKPRPARGVRFRTRFGQTEVFVRETPGPDHDAPVAVLLHGLAGSSSNWTDLAGVLAARLRSLAVDLPGFGLSEPPEEFDYSRRAHADVVIGLLDELGTGPVHLFGNSFGGAVAIEVAARRPDLVASLMLISPAMPDRRPSLRRVSDRRMALAMLPLVGRRARRQLAAVTPEERAGRLLRLCFADPDGVPPHRVEEAAEELRERAQLPWADIALGRTTRGLVRSWFVTPSRSLWLLLDRIEAPALVVWGYEDRLVSSRKAPRTARALRRGRLLVLPRTGHVAQMERPRLLAGAAVAMLDEVLEGTW
jgi:pimeloyl-ACP methyl ester carboxylesterase